MTFFGIIGLAWLIYALIERSRKQPAPKKPGKVKLRYKFDARQNRALALAHPIAQARGMAAFADPKAPPLTPQQAQMLRASLLHILGLRANIDDATIRAALPGLLRRQWFRIDLDRLRPEDDARAAMAFASARLAFAVRSATLLGWLDQALQWEVLYQNAQRASDCFGSWQEFGLALARGRQQWIAGARADSLGVAFDEATLAQWLGSRGHPWRSMAWHGLVLFDAPAAP